MGLAFILIGIIVLVVAIRNSYASLWQALDQDLFNGGFVGWIIAIAVVAAAGYVPAIRTPARYFLGLMVLVFMFTKGSGFFDQLNSATSASPSSGGLSLSTNAVDKAQAPPLQNGLPIDLLNGAGSNNPVSQVAGAAKSAFSFATMFGGMFGL